MNRLRSAALVAALAITPALAIAAPAQAATGTISGSVTCVNGWLQNSKPVGIWVDSNKADGWATLSSGTGATGGWTTNFSFSAKDATSFTLHIGCGGTSANWKTNTKKGPYGPSTQKLTIRY
jgi:hypothetical protein